MTWLWDVTLWPPETDEDPMQPYNESLVFQTNEKVKALYVEAAHPLDEQYPIWIARTVYDYCAGMSWNASEAKHLRELREALGLPVIIPPQPPAELPLVRCNFCNLTESSGRPIFSSCLAAQPLAIQEEWIERERLAGGTHYVISIQAGYTDYPPEIDFYATGRMPEWLEAVDRIFVAGLVPVVFLHGGGPYPGNDYFRKVLAEIPRDYYSRCLWVTAWEPVAGSWTSRQFRDGALATRAALGPEPVMACHLSQGRLSFSSNPREADDPWSDEMDCWRSGWGPSGHPFGVLLYQSYVVPQGDVMDVHKPGSWGERAKEVADRALGNPGVPDWFAGITRPVLVWYEATAYDFIRGHSTSEWAREVARSAQTLGYVGFGNGLP